MTWYKRFFDIVVAILLTLCLSPVILVVSLAILVIDGRPIFYVSERMRCPTRSFSLVKFRTMKTVSTDAGVSGGDKTSRITKMGSLLRGKRLDEIPQLWNVLKGDISFVGPRPPLRQYVEKHPEVYDQVLKSRPGITGLASIVYHRYEEKLLACCNSPEETDAVYSRICIPRKAALDLIYQRNSSFCLDLVILIRTAFHLKG